MKFLRFLMTGSALGIVLPVVLFSAKSAAARSVDPSWTSWTLDLKGVNGDYQAIWYVTIGGDDKSGNPVTLHVEPIPLKCNAVGNVDVQGDDLLFDGGYVECDFPDLIATANRIITNLWGSQYVLKIGPDCNCSPIRMGYAAANLTPKMQDVGPVFHHPNIRFGVDIAKDEVSNAFHFAGEDSSGPAVKVNPGGRLETRYHCDEQAGVCFYDHYRDGQLITKDKRNFRIPTFSTTAVTVYIGHDPSSGARFTGVMRDLLVDPGCRAH